MQNHHFLHPVFMTKLLCSTFVSLLLFLSVQGQDRKETSAYFDLIKAIISTENSGNSAVYRLDTLKSKFIPSRSHVTDYFNRDIDFGFKHRRILMSLNFAGYQIDLFCRKDTIVLSSVASADYKSISYDNYNKEVIDQYLKQRNKFYSSSKTARQLIKEISLPEEYAFYCGDGMPKTQKGKYIEQLVDDENIATLTDMLKSLNCETQAYGVAGLQMLEKRDYQISYDTQKLIDHIKERNSELVVCSGCLSGLIEKIVSHQLTPYFN
jgi:2-hydroxy-3-keto-5-methylthiopentenyl-1-phosphate phosphatase